MWLFLQIMISPASQYPAKFGTYGSQRGFQKCSLQSQNEDDSKQECSQGFMNLTDSELSELPFD